jgi:D-glycero-D-manno-heptose 1,7-bisphosphate phosphatase
MAEAARPAVFFDRDGTIVADTGYLHEPELVKLLPGAVAAIRRLSAAGYLIVVVTNQSGIARGLYGVAEFQAVERRIADLLASDGGGTRIDASYFCPHSPEDPEPCECRKPGTKLFREAQGALGIDFSRSWWVGDRLSDVQPAITLGGRGILLNDGERHLHQGQARALGVTVVADLPAAADEILGQTNP